MQSLSASHTKDVNPFDTPDRDACDPMDVVGVRGLRDSHHAIWTGKITASDKKVPAMTLFDVLTAISFVAPISAAMASANHAHAGFWGYAIALFLSLILGTACGWTLRTSARRVAMILGDHPKTFRKRFSEGIYLCLSLLWLFFAALLGVWTTSSALELLRLGAR